MRFAPKYRPADLIARLITILSTGDTLLDPTSPALSTWNRGSITRTLEELQEAGVIRTIRNRQGQAIAHRLTTLGLAWWKHELHTIPTIDPDLGTWTTPTTQDPTPLYDPTP